MPSRSSVSSESPSPSPIRHPGQRICICVLQQSRQIRSSLLGSFLPCRTVVPPAGGTSAARGWRCPTGACGCARPVVEGDGEGCVEGEGEDWAGGCEVGLVCA